jgi:hypothetical protein
VVRVGSPAAMPAALTVEATATALDEAADGDKGSADRRACVAASDPAVDPGFAMSHRDAAATGVRLAGLSDTPRSECFDSMVADATSLRGPLRAALAHVASAANLVDVPAGDGYVLLAVLREVDLISGEPAERGFLLRPRAIEEVLTEHSVGERVRAALGRRSRVLSGSRAHSAVGTTTLGPVGMAGGPRALGDEGAMGYLAQCLLRAGEEISLILQQRGWAIASHACQAALLLCVMAGLVSVSTVRHAFLAGRLLDVQRTSEALRLFFLARPATSSWVLGDRLPAAAAEVATGAGRAAPAPVGPPPSQPGASGVGGGTTHLVPAGPPPAPAGLALDPTRVWDGVTCPYCGPAHNLTECPRRCQFRGVFVEVGKTWAQMKPRRPRAGADRRVQPAAAPAGARGPA